ncbi:two-component system, sensor histidine kinase RegB [Nitrosomonas cryotolerans]|uniref:histidine kinase n=1 Tax=Nitrosomonas cryotolerans ATCC 49181 TaxID=1131553 RepID=A0A1N6FIQ9_9PROT|nr:ATP-binding protein [Nitrosomonas cryotolerans]SFP62390.1 two-component system, sensor histidine kinase RegB [Nitrosomonas cryotolerans]SIN95134.1 two-component system, sensor histidine kinase RegB [Nitrosomonas cryotolerans ATCC 49181]
MFSDLNQFPLSKNLQRLFLLRNIAIISQCAVIAMAYWIIEIVLPWTEMIIVVAVLATLNLFTRLRLSHNWPVSHIEFFAQLLVDVLALSALLYFSGGSTNPFISLYLLPLTITAATLPWRYTWVMATITISCYSLLLFNYMPLPHDHSSDHSKHMTEFNLHVIGMWLAFMLSTVIIAGFVVKMSISIRDRDRDLAKVREQALRNEQIIALGTLAAGAAHELGTPLSTMAVVTGELQHEYLLDSEFQNNIRILRDQIRHCKQTLTQLLADAGQTRAEEGSGQSVDHFLSQILDKWKLIQPSVKFTYHSDGIQPTPKIMNNHLLSQSILNLLNNAADASSKCVDIKSNWDHQTLHLEIIDDGEGLSVEAKQHAGEAFFTSKAPGQGFGIGLFLANANIERFGGSVHLFDHENGGACIQVTLPLIGQPA